MNSLNRLDAICEYNSQKDSITESENRSTNFDNLCYQFVTHSIVCVRERLLAMPTGSWLFWDLDDTLWVDDVYKYNRSYATFAFRLVEKEVIPLIRALKEKGIYVIGLTRRLSSTNVNTDETLRKVGVRFSYLPVKDGFILKDNYYHPAIYENGVIYTSDFRKGEVVTDLLNCANRLNMELPPEIGLIDDLAENLVDVRRELKEGIGTNIPFLEIHYTAVDKKASKPVPKISEEMKQIIETCEMQ